MSKLSIWSLLFLASCSTQPNTATVDDASPPFALDAGKLPLLPPDASPDAPFDAGEPDAHRLDASEPDAAEPDAALALVPPNHLTVWELGDSLTRGDGSSPSTAPPGYRKALAAWAPGLTFVGTTVTGDWPDARHDGHPGYTIEQLQVVVHAEWLTPNVPGADIVILVAGTNNATSSTFSLTTAIADYEALLGAVLKPVATRVLVSTIPPVNSPGAEANVEAFNAALPAVWSKFGSRLIIADLFKALSPWSADHFINAAHPNDVGYPLVAAELERALAVRP